MAVDERALQALYRKLQDVLGQDAANTMMARLAPSDEVVTKADVVDLREDVDALRQDIDQRCVGIEHSVSGLKEQFEWGFAAVSERVAGGQQEVLATMRSEMVAQTAPWCSA